MTPFPHNDDPERAIKVHVTQGESHVSTDPQVVMTTVLGSCIAACIRDPQAGVGGMNHFLLPDAGDGRGGDAVRYGAYAMEILINDLLKRGARREQGIPIVSSSTGGVSARRVEFWPASGRVRQRLVAVDNAPQDVRRPTPPPMPAVASGDVDLF
jgi:chemotaxis protein CheD